MPQYQLVDNETGRELLVESDSPPTEAEVSKLFQNHDAFKVAIAGPKGSEERRRVMAREVADQSRQTFTEESGGSTAGPLLSGTASLGQSLSAAGTKILGGAASGFEMLKEGLGAPEGGFSLPEPGKLPRTPAEVEQDIQANQVRQQARELQAQAEATYPVNPKYPWANLPGQVVGSVAQMLATGPARIPAYALSALEGGMEQARESGATPAQVQAQGLVEAATGAVSEKLLGLAPFLKDAGKMTARQFARQALTPTAGKVALQEAIQEPTEGILNRLSSKYVTGANPDEAVWDPQTLAMEAVGGGLGGAGLSIPTLAGAKIQRQRDVMGRRELGLAGRSEQQLQAELEAFNQGIQQSQLTGGGVELVQQTGDPYRNQLNLSAQNAPPQFQMVTSPRTARGLLRSETDSGLGDFAPPDGRTPIDQFIGRTRQAAVPSAEDRRAALEAGLTLPQDTGKFASDEPQVAIPPRYAQAPQLASLGTTPRTAMTTSPIDEAIMGGRLQRSTLPPINPQLQQLQDLAESELNAIERFPNRDTNRRDSLLGAAPQVVQMLDTRINNSIGKVSDAEVGRLMDLRERLAKFYNDQTAYNELTAEAIGVARDTRRPAPQMAAGLSQLEQSRQAQFPAGGAAVQPEQPQSIQPQGDLMARLREARQMDVLRQPSPMSAAQLGTGQPVGGPPAVADLTPFLQFYEAQASAPQAPVQAAPEAPVTQSAPVRRGVRMRAKTSRSIGMSRKPSQTITGSNVQTGTEMPVLPTGGEAPISRTESKPRQMSDEELAAMKVAKLKGAEHRGDGITFVPEKLMTPERRKAMKRGGSLIEVKPMADVTGVQTDRGYAILDRRSRIAFRGNEPVQAEAVDAYGIKPPKGYVRQGELYVYQPISRSEPAAAQGVATEGVGVSSSEETPAFGVRRYGDALFISIAEYNRLRPQIDERLAAGDEVAKRIDDIEVNAEQYVRSSAGFGALTPEGQEQAVGNFKTKLYQSAAKWLAGGEFQFSPPVIAKSVAMDIGKSVAEKDRKRTQSGETSEEDGEEVRGDFESLSERVMPKQPLKAPPAIRKADQDIVLVVANVRRQFGLNEAQMARIMGAYVDPEMEANLDDEELGVLERVRPMLARLENVRYSVAGGIQLTEQGPFYSQLTRTIQGMGQETMTVGQARSAIEKGAKKDEVAMSGIFTDPLSPLYGKQPGDKVTKSELIGYALERQAKVEDVVLGEPRGKNLSGTYQDRKTGEWVVSQNGREERFSSLNEAARRGDELNRIADQSRETSFSSYQLPGADEGSYREMFVTWPYTGKSLRVDLTPDNKWGVFSGKTLLEKYTDKIYAEHALKHRLNWRDGHSQYASIANPIVRIRRNIRTDANGKKTYFIEEIQGPQKANQEKMPPELRKRIYEIGMKRAIRDAVDSGADAIAWTTGQQQADRYDLSKQVLHVAWEKNDDGTYNINAPQPDGSPGVYKEDLSLDQVEELVGKDLAKKIESGEGRQQEKDGGYRSWKILEGVDLIGGDGLRRLYDQTLPSIANDLAKKFGVRVGMGEIATAAKYQFSPRAARDGTGKPILLNGVQAYVLQDIASGDYLADRNQNTFARRPQDGQLFSKGEADSIADKKTSDFKANVHSLAIPEAMKAAAKTGLPLFSLSSLIREPIGLARAQQAVARWKQENGVEGALIEVVDDPELMTPDGRPVAAMVRTIPGQPPVITVNAAQISSEQELIEKLWHEALHPVWEDQGVQRAWQEVLQTLPRNAIQAELARGYSPLEATMEAAINSAATQAANTPLRTAWKKFLDAVWEAMGRVFGFTTKPKDFEKLMEEALRSLSRPYNQEGELRYSVANTIAMVSSAKATKATLETSGDPQAVAMMGQAAASLINPAFSDLMNRLSVAEPGTADATTYTFLKAADNMAASGAAVVEWAQSHQDPIPAFTNLSDLPTGWRSVVGNVVMGAHLQLGQQMGSIDRAIERESAKLVEAAADLEDASKERLSAEAAETQALDLLDGLMRTIVVERKKIGTSSATLSRQQAEDQAKAIFGIKRNKLSALTIAIQTMAREMPVEGFVNNEAALAWFDERQSKNPILGDSAADVVKAFREALSRQADLTKRIEQVRAFTLDSVDAVREVGEIAKLIGKNKKATINNYAKLRSEYEAGFRRFKLASKKATDASTRLDGLLAAKEALSGLMASPEYLEKTNDAFLRGRGSLSGLMSEVKSDGRPTGVVEVYGPSAYVAAGNRVAKDKDLAALRRNSTIETWGKKGKEKSGTIYEIDYRPDFAIEAKNVEAIDRLSQEITQALNDESSPFYLTDPLARSSYTQLGAYLAQFVATNRYLIEQQLSDTMLLTVLKGGRIFSGKAGILSAFGGALYTTRMNAARAIGGRGGMEWEKANRASDLFEKKAGNVLKATRVENAVARRKAIESHGLNPDSREGIAQWSAHISSVIGSFQNPSQDRLKEGDYVGGMVVTKEDLKSAEIQKKFSTGVVGDFSSMTADLSEVVNPEEKFGSGDSAVLFTRAAEDYGLKTRRQFSQWGRQFKEDWATASEKDLEAFRLNQAQSTGDEPVPMVWTEREKLADREIEGPVYSHLTETNQEYSSKAPASIRPAYARLRSAIKAGRGPKTVEGIGEAISQLTSDAEGNATIDPITAKEALLGAIDLDVNAIGKAIGEWHQSTLGNSDLPDVLIGVKAANGALALARGKMVAPTWFYDYGLHDDMERAVFVAQGKRILLMKVYETMGTFKEAVRRNLDEANREIEENAKKRKANGDVVGYDAAEAEYDKKSKAKYRDGGEFATRKGLQRSFDTLEALQSELKSVLQVANEAAVDQLKARTIGSLARLQISVLLSSVSSILNNMTAVVADPWRTWSQSERFFLKVGKTTKAVKNAFKFMASDMVARLPASIRNKLTKKRKMVLISTVSDFLRTMMAERDMMEQTGQFEEFESIKDKVAAIRANPLSFGQSTTMESSKFERAMSWLYSKAIYGVAVAEWVRDRAPGYFDKVINRVLAEDAKEFELWLSPHLWNWARNQPGATVEEKIENARKSVIRGSDLGISDENIASIRDFMSAAGSLESMAIRLLSDNGDKKMTTKKSSLSDGELQSVQYDAGRKYNVRASSTSPDVMKGGPGIKGTFKNILHTFLSWTFHRMGTDANQFFKKRGGGWKKEVTAAWGVAMLVLATLLLGAMVKIPKDIWRWVTGDPATTPNILQAVDSPEMAMRYMAASTAPVFPIGGQVIAEMMGGSGISSPLDNNVLDNNPPAQFLASMVQTGQRIYQTGDLKYPLVDFARKNFWPAGLVLNRVMEGDTEARAAKRAVRMAAAGMEVRPSGSGIGSRETPITPITRNAIAALYEGDTGAFNTAREKAIAHYVGQGKTPKEAAKRFDSSVSGRDPLRSVLGRNPTEEEEATILRRLNPSQRRAVGKSRSLFRKPKKIRLGRSKSRKVRLGRKRPARRSLRLRRAAS